jgi:hypothetical protein
MTLSIEAARHVREFLLAWTFDDNSEQGTEPNRAAFARAHGALQRHCPHDEHRNVCTICGKRVGPRQRNVTNTGCTGRLQ